MIAFVQLVSDTLGHLSDWILQSVKHKKRMPEFEFLLYRDTQQLRIS